MDVCHRCRQEVSDSRTLTVHCGVDASVYHECGIGGSFTQKEGQALIICKDCRGEFLRMMGGWFKAGYEGKQILCISASDFASKMYDRLTSIVDHTRVKLCLTNHDPWYPDRWVLRVECDEAARETLLTLVRSFGKEE